MSRLSQIALNSLVGVTSLLGIPNWSAMASTTFASISASGSGSDIRGLNIVRGLFADFRGLFADFSRKTSNNFTRPGEGLCASGTTLGSNPAKPARAHASPSEQRLYSTLGHETEPQGSWRFRGWALPSGASVDAVRLDKASNSPPTFARKSSEFARKRARVKPGDSP